MIIEQLLISFVCMFDCAAHERERESMGRGGQRRACECKKIDVRDCEKEWNTNENSSEVIVHTMFKHWN